jgi:hypothetical protein
MKYLLILGIEYKHFKKPADISVFLGQRFIDTFELTQDYGQANNALETIDRKWFDDTGRQHALTSESRKEKWMSVPKLYKIYHIDAEYLVDDLLINVENDDSDYSNGFFKNSSLIKFAVALMPTHFMAKHGTKYLSSMYRLLEGFEKYKKRGNWKQHTRPDVTFYGRWPLAGTCKVIRKVKKFEDDKVVDSKHWIGGSFTAIFEIKSKHGIKILANDKQEQFGFFASVCEMSLLLGACKPLLNTYYNENL